METNKIIKNAKILNWITIIVTFVMYIVYRAISTSAKSITTQEQLDRLLKVESTGRLIMGAAAVVVIICTIMLMAKNNKKVKGLGLLLASGIVTLAFAVLGMMAGIIVWILCGASLNKLKQKDAEEDFEAKLQEEVSGDEVFEASANDAAEN